jgi:hypothetical protein
MQSSQVDSLLSDEVHVNGETATELLKKANDQHPLSGQSLPEPQATNPANAEGKEDVKEDDGEYSMLLATTRPGRLQEDCLSLAHIAVLWCKCLRNVEWILSAKVPS